MKVLLFLSLFIINLIEGTIINTSRCKPGEINVDKCGNICRCLGDGVHTLCTKINCPAYEQVQRSPGITALLDTIPIQTFSRSSGRLFTDNSISAKKSIILMNMDEEA